MFLINFLADKVHGTSQTAWCMVLTGLAAGYAIKRYLAPSPLARIPGPPSSSFFTGHLLLLAAGKNDMRFCNQITEQYGGVVKLNTLFGSNSLYISDPLALQFILKEPEIFRKPSYINVGLELVFGPGLLSSDDASHRRQRKMLNPIFTAPYIRDLNPVFYEVAHQLRDVLKTKISSQKESVNMVQPLAQVALELIGQAGLGHNFGSLEGRSDRYVEASKELLPGVAAVGFLIPLIQVLTQFGSPSFRRKVADSLPWPGLRRLLRVVDVLDDTTMKIYEHKKQLLQNDSPARLEGLIGEGKDIISQLLKVNAEASSVDALAEKELTAQLNSLTFAATDTSSSALCRILQLLSTNQDLQTRLRDEIVEARKANGGNDLSYQAIDDLQILSAVIRETLRLYPPVPHIPRRSLTDSVVPLRYPINSTDGKTQIDSIYVPEGTDIYIGIVSANTDKRIWGPNALEWKPERWLSPLPQSVIDAKVPGVLAGLMTFSTGAKSCIGYRFALQEIKVVLCVLLESFRFKPDVDIEWHVGFVMSPFASGDNSESKLPLQVEYIGV